MSTKEKRTVDRKYSSLARSIWNHPKFKRLPKPKANPQTLLFRLLIAPESNSIPGLFQAFRGGLCDALEWSPRSFDKCFKQLSEDGWVLADWKSGLIWVPGAIEQDGNQPANPNVVRSWRGPLAELPDCELKEKAIRELTRWASEKGESWAKALGEALGKRRPMPSPNPSGKTPPKNEPKPLVKPLVKPSPKTRPKQEAGTGSRKQEQEASKLSGDLSQRVVEFERGSGEPPAPRQDPMFQKFGSTRWFPSQQWLDWAKEAGISNKLFDQTLVEARDKLSGAHDIEWWDMKILRFFEAALSRAGRHPEASQTPVVSP